MKNERFSAPAVGAASLLAIFSVLCLVTFTMLSLSTAKSQEGLSRASAEAVSGYYEADSMAEEILAKLRSGERPEGVTAVSEESPEITDGNGDRFRYSCPISETQRLEVEVRLQGESYQILRWQAVSTVDWQADDRIDVWSGQ